MTIAITGGSGFIGTGIAQKLLALGDTVIVIDRVSPRFTHEHLFYIQCDLTQSTLPFNVLEQVDAVVNLVGAPINKKWTLAHKKEIKDSRLSATRNLVESMRASTSRPTVLVNASASGFYGERGQDELTEHDTKGEGFLADVVALWEQEALRATEFGTRVVCIRTAPVVGHGGMLTELLKTRKFGFLLALTKKEFWQPWIHIDDITNCYLFAIQTQTLQGPVNAVAPEEVIHRVFMETLGKAVHRKVLGSIPRPLAKALFGELLGEITKSQRMSSKLLIDKGFVFQYPTLLDALKEAAQ